MTVFLSLGSNIGDKGYYLNEAIKRLEAHPAIDVTTVSGIYETEPWGEIDQPSFWNQAVQIKTSLNPHELLDYCQAIEINLGRERLIHWGPRTVDIDILLYDDKIVKDERLTIPHPYLEEREFVLAPLREIAPELVLPSGRELRYTYGAGQIKELKTNLYRQ